MLFTKVALIYSKAFYNSLQCDLPLDKVFLVNPRTWTWKNMDVQELEEKLNFRMENSETLKIVQRVTEIIDVIFELAEKLPKVHKSCPKDCLANIPPIDILLSLRQQLHSLKQIWELSVASEKFCIDQIRATLKVTATKVLQTKNICAQIEKTLARKNLRKCQN